MERREPPWKHYIPIKISDDIKMKSQRGSRSFREISHLIRIAFDDSLYLTSHDLYVAILKNFASHFMTD